jgi:hypothetical protein
MTYRGMRLRRDGHDRCGLLSESSFSSTSAALFASGVHASIERTSHGFGLRTSTSITILLSVACRKDRTPCHETQQDAVNLGCSRTRPGGVSHGDPQALRGKGLAQLARECDVCREFIGESS